MISSFKNFERLRYRLSNDMRDMINESKKENAKMRDKISSTVFATVFSALISKIVFNDMLIKKIHVLEIVFLIFLFVILYIFLFIIYSYISRQLENYFLDRKTHRNDSSVERLVKDFDNIACDCILEAIEYKKGYFQLENIEKQLKSFYFFEVMHYLNTAAKKTKELVRNKDRCIKSLENKVGVDLFRVTNAKNIMEELIEFLMEEIEHIEIDNNQKETIVKCINNIKNNINDIN